MYYKPTPTHGPSVDYGSVSIIVLVINATIIATRLAPLGGKLGKGRVAFEASDGANHDRIINEPCNMGAQLEGAQKRPGGGSLGYPKQERH